MSTYFRKFICVNSVFAISDFPNELYFMITVIYFHS